VLQKEISHIWTGIGDKRIDTKRAYKYTFVPGREEARETRAVRCPEEKVAVVFRVPESMQNLLFSRSCFAEDGKEMDKYL